MSASKAEEAEVPERDDRKAKDRSPALSQATPRTVHTQKGFTVYL